MEDIRNADYTKAKRVYKDFRMKKLGKYHDFYVQCDTLLLTDNFRNMCFEIYELDPDRFVTAPGLVRYILKKDQSKIRSFN